MDFILSYLANFLQGRIKTGAFYCFLFEGIWNELSFLHLSNLNSLLKNMSLSFAQSRINSSSFTICTSVSSSELSR